MGFFDKAKNKIKGMQSLLNATSEITAIGQEIKARSKATPSLTADQILAQYKSKTVFMGRWYKMGLNDKHLEDLVKGIVKNK